MAAPDPAPHAGRVLGFERFLLFSDAVFAIAITLLVLDLKPSLSSAGEFVIAPVIPNLIGFGLSFYVVGRYWLAHHQLFEAVRTYDRRLLTANLAFLASIVFLPFPTSVVALGKPVSRTVIFYTLSVAAVGLLMVALGVADPAAGAAEARRNAGRHDPGHRQHVRLAGGVPGQRRRGAVRRPPGPVAPAVADPRELGGGPAGSGVASEGRRPI